VSQIGNESSTGAAEVAALREELAAANAEVAALRKKLADIERWTLTYVTLLCERGHECQAKEAADYLGLTVTWTQSFKVEKQ
jgi:hypothetical protein